MPSLNRPDVYLSEVLLPQQQVYSSSQAVGAFMGVLPQGPTLAPTLVNSWSDFITYFGGFPASGTDDDLAHAVYQFFANGGRQAYVLRVTASGTPAVLATKTLVDRAATPQNTIRVDALSPGVWGNNLYAQVLDRDTSIGRFDFVVYKGGSTAGFAIERFVDLSMVPTDGRYFVNIINSTVSGSVYVRVTNLNSGTASPNNVPSLNGGVPSQLTSGADGSAPSAADLQAAFPLFNSVPGPILLNVPGNSTNAVLTSAIAYAEARGDVFCIIDTPKPTDTTIGGVANAVTTTQALTPSSYAAVYYPWLMMLNPNSVGAQATRATAPGGVVAGIIARTDQVRGVFKAPAGTSTATVTGATALAGTVSTIGVLTTSDLDTLNGANINAIKFVPGAGIVVWGTRTLFKTGITRYISPRRTLIYLKQALKQATQFAVFENNDANLWAQINTVCLRIVSGLWQQGGLKGTAPTEAFYVLCDGTINTPSVVAAGEVRVQVGVALQYPAEFVTITLTQFDGGASVTDTASTF
jgi:uncharacterized protein